MKRAAIALLTAILFGACRPSTPSGVIPPNRMEALLYDYHIAQGMAEQGDSMEQRRYAYILAAFEKHGVTEAEFDSSMVWYCAHSYELRDIYTRISARLEAESVDGLEVIASHDNAGNLWPAQQLVALQSTRTQRLLHVTAVPPDSVSNEASEYSWRFQTNFIQRDGRRNATATIVLHHEGDSVVTATRSITSDYNVDLRVRQAKGLKLLSIDCYLFMPPTRDKNTSTSILVITHPTLLREESYLLQR